MEYQFGGLFVGISTFLIIGLFHPICIKAEYYFGTRCWWGFLVVGVAGTLAAMCISDVAWSSFFGVFAFSCFWTIKEIFDQEERVKKGWFPRNPNRSYYWDNDCEEPLKDIS
eukprot:Blabericola_migrator_1__3739@NODE_211_length_11365_cov_144_425828_g181_i0_p13_GENE_NODE_211_length_11365_cov_144_425828_g181_i0NODE_211_length_11365_cov_144_425828_g181_i0_p13_ORF_typecomplete_len112_score7_98DUF4491/PF14898_6/2e41_NODE_211_length_11365_cov_144_425828_g181_i013691704